MHQKATLNEPTDCRLSPFSLALGFAHQPGAGLLDGGLHADYRPSGRQFGWHTFRAAQSVRLQQLPDNFEHDFLIAGLGRQGAAYGIGGRFLGGDGA